MPVRMRACCIPALLLLLVSAVQAQNVSFAPEVNYTVGTNPLRVAVADFNGDGKLDLAVTNNFSFDSTVSILLGRGDGTFQPQVKYSSGGASPYPLVVGDFNRDGKLDVAVSNFNSIYMGVLLGNGDGSFQAPLLYKNGGGAINLVAADLNGDGKLDLVEPGLVILGNGDGTFAPPVYYPVPNGYSAVIGDFNGDKKLDLAVVEAKTPGAVAILLGNGDGTFQGAAPYSTVDSGVAIVEGDFAHNGKLDLAVVSAPTSSVNILLGNGDGTFQTAGSYGGTTDCCASAIVTADFNGDGNLDLAVAYNAGVAVLLGNGDGTFQSQVLFQVAVSPASSLAVGDFNGDGKPDLAVVNGDNTVGILLNTTVPPGPATHFSLSANPSTPAGNLFTVAVTALDKNNNTAVSYSGHVHFSSSDPAATVPPDSTLMQGVGNFNVTLRTAGNQIITGTDTVNASVTGGFTVAVTALAASHLAVAAPSSTVRGSAFSITVAAQDTFNNTATGYAGTIHFTSSDGAAALPVNYAFVPADQGAHAFLNAATLNTLGIQTITATDNASVTGTSAPILVTNNKIVLTSSLNPAYFKHAQITFTATIIPVGFTGTATGSVVFKDGNTPIGSAPLNGSGVAVLGPISNLHIGAHIITASYAGDSTFQPSISPPLSQQRSPAPRPVP